VGGDGMKDKELDKKGIRLPDELIRKQISEIIEKTKNDHAIQKQKEAWYLKRLGK
jgi:hypothetical protein